MRIVGAKVIRSPGPRSRRGAGRRPRSPRPSPASDAAAVPAIERAVLHIQRHIQIRGLRPGDQLPSERALARDMGLSRPTVRSALKSLGAMGAVCSRHRAGTFIQTGPPVLDSEALDLLATLHGLTAEQMFEALRILEVGAAELSARRASAEQMAAMADTLASLCECLADAPAFLLQEMRFPRAVAAGSSNRVLAALVDMVATLVYKWRRTAAHRPGELQGSADMHRRIYDAVRRRDAEGLREAMADHLRPALAGVRVGRSR